MKFERPLQELKEPFKYSVIYQPVVKGENSQLRGATPSR
jgi:hypothetical protein